MQFGPGTFRLCLAAAVLLSHLSRWDFGRPAVMLFFMLSGYWVARMQDGPHHLPVPLYFASRLARIWPATAVAAILAFISYAVLGIDARGSLPSTLALLGLATRGNDSVGTIWSLDIELQFYALLPLLLMASGVFRQRVLLAAASVAALAIGGLLFLGVGAVTVLRYLPMFAVGLSFYLAPVAVSGRTAIASLVSGVAVLAVINWPGLYFHDHPQVFRDYVFMVAALAFVPFIAWNIRQPSGETDRLLGALSFPLYLVQEPCIVIARDQLGGAAYWKLAAVGMSVMATAALYLCVDAPAERARKRVFAGGRVTVHLAS